MGAKQAKLLKGLPLEDANVAITEQQALYIWQAFDADGDGQLDRNEWTEFVRAWMVANKVKGEPKEMSARLFEKFDKNADGRITLDELRETSGEDEPSDKEHSGLRKDKDKEPFKRDREAEEKNREAWLDEVMQPGQSETRLFRDFDGWKETFEPSKKADGEKKPAGKLAHKVTDIAAKKITDALVSLALQDAAAALSAAEIFLREPPCQFCMRIPMSTAEKKEKCPALKGYHHPIPHAKNHREGDGAPLRKWAIKAEELGTQRGKLVPPSGYEDLGASFSILGRRGWISAPYQPLDDETVAFEFGDEVEVCGLVDEHWSRGKREGDGTVASFPATLLSLAPFNAEECLRAAERKAVLEAERKAQKKAAEARHRAETIAATKKAAADRAAAEKRAKEKAIADKLAAEKAAYDALSKKEKKALQKKKEKEQKQADKDAKKAQKEAEKAEKAKMKEAKKSKKKGSKSEAAPTVPPPVAPPPEAPPAAALEAPVVSVQTAKVSPSGPLCEECAGDEIATLSCFECGMLFCRACSEKTHSKGKRRYHTIKPVNENAPTHDLDLASIKPPDVAAAAQLAGDCFNLSSAVLLTLRFQYKDQGRFILTREVAVERLLALARADPALFKEAMTVGSHVLVQHLELRAKHPTPRVRLSDTGLASVDAATIHLLRRAGTPEIISQVEALDAAFEDLGLYDEGEWDQKTHDAAVAKAMEMCDEKYERLRGAVGGVVNSLFAYALGDEDVASLTAMLK